MILRRFASLPLVVADDLLGLVDNRLEVLLVLETLGVDLVDGLGADGRAANQPLRAMTLRPSIGALFPCARVIFATIGSPARFDALTASGDNLSSLAFCSGVAGASMRV
jgi:hypothetical protein